MTEQTDNQIHDVEKWAAEKLNADMEEAERAFSNSQRSLGDVAVKITNAEAAWIKSNLDVHALISDSYKDVLGGAEAMDVQGNETVNAMAKEFQDMKKLSSGIQDAVAMMEADFRRATNRIPDMKAAAEQALFSMVDELQGQSR